MEILCEFLTYFPHFLFSKNFFLHFCSVQANEIYHVEKKLSQSMKAIEKLLNNRHTSNINLLKWETTRVNSLKTRLTTLLMISFVKNSNIERSTEKTTQRRLRRVRLATPVLMTTTWEVTAHPLTWKTNSHSREESLVSSEILLQLTTSEPKDQARHESVRRRHTLEDCSTKNDLKVGALQTWTPLKTGLGRLQPTLVSQIWESQQMLIAVPCNPIWESFRIEPWEKRPKNCRKRMVSRRLSLLDGR